MAREAEQQNQLVLSYHSVRQALGWLGIALPLILLMGAATSKLELEPSISDFFHTVFRDVFVGIMCAIGVFLFSYKGYEFRRGEGDWFSDRALSRVAGIAAIGLALFPIMPAEDQISASALSQQMVGTGVSQNLHYLFALSFFVSLIFFSLVQFPKTRDEGRRPIYIWSGVVLVGVTAGLIAVFAAGKLGGKEVEGTISDRNIVFWLEAIGIWAFGVSWLTKGKADVALRWATRRVG